MKETNEVAEKRIKNRLKTSVINGDGLDIQSAICEAYSFGNSSEDIADMIISATTMTEFVESVKTEAESGKFLNGKIKSSFVDIFYFAVKTTTLNIELNIAAKIVSDAFVLPQRSFNITIVAYIEEELILKTLIPQSMLGTKYAQGAILVPLTLMKQVLVRFIEAVVNEHYG